MTSVQNAHGVVLRVLEDAGDGWKWRWRCRRAWQGGGTGDCEGCGFLNVGDVGSKRAFFAGDDTVPVGLAGGYDDLRVIR